MPSWAPDLTFDVLTSYGWVLVPAGLFAVFLAIFVTWILRFPGRRVSRIELGRSARFFHPNVVLPESLDTIVIGSGSGGCTCANLLAQAGHKVLLLEQHNRTGGCTHSFQERGCEWDTGLHYTSMGMSDRKKRPGALMNFMSKGMQKWTRLCDPYDEIVFPNDDNVQPGLPNNQNYPFMAGAANTVDSIVGQIDPSNNELRKRTQTWLDFCHSINEGFTALGLKRVLPKMLHFLLQERIDRLMKYASYTVRDAQYAIFNLGMTAQQILQEGCPQAPEGCEPDPVYRRIKAVMTHPIGDYAVQPREATVAAHGVTMCHYMNGACYSVGPTQQISDRTSSLLRELGGEALVDATVQDILVEDGRAVGVRVAKTSFLAAAKAAAANGKPCAPPEVVEIRAKNVVCATSVYNLYNTLLPQDLAVVKDFQDPTKRTVRQSNGHLYLFCKIRGDPDEIGLPKHNKWYFNGYDMDEAYDRYFENPRKVRPPMVYIGFPCTKDTTWKKRYPGISNCILISDGLWEWFEKWKNTLVQNRGADYDTFKQDLSKHLLDILYEVAPEAKDKVEFFELGTPLSEVTYLSSFHGGSYGTQCTPDMFSSINRSWTTTPHTRIPGLFLAGSDAFLPSVCGAMYGGFFGAAAVLGHLGTVRVVFHIIGDLAASLVDENPKLSWPRAYALAFRRFIKET